MLLVQYALHHNKTVAHNTPNGLLRLGRHTAAAVIVGSYGYWSAPPSATTTTGRPCRKLKMLRCVRAVVNLKLYYGIRKAQ